MFLLHEPDRALLHLLPGSQRLELSPVASFRRERLPFLLRLGADGGTLRQAFGGKAVCLGAGGFALGRADQAARWTVVPSDGGMLSLGFGDGFLRVEADGSVMPDAADAASAARFRPVDTGTAFRLIERRLAHPWPPRRTGRLLQLRQPARQPDGPVTLRHGRVISLDWVVVLPGETAFAHGTAHVRRRVRAAALAYPLPRPRRVETACMLGGHYNFYHHLVDYMLNWFGVRDVVDDATTLLTLPPTQRFQAEILDAFGITDRILPCPELTATRVGRLILPRQAVVGSGQVRDRATIDACRAFLDARIGAPGATPQRIFVSRAKARSRRATNEARAIAIAEGFGFRPVFLEELDFLAQVALFRNAEAVAGLHGAGFANLIFAPDGCRLIEVMPTGTSMPKFFENLSQGLGHGFTRVTAGGRFQATDLEIDLDGFAKALESSLGGGPPLRPPPPPAAPAGPPAAAPASAGSRG